MKYLITLLIAALSLNAFGQTDGWEYPFPYNPDGDTDGYIGLNDLLDLLALYGNEYPDSFHYDDSGAILYLGQLSGHDCYSQAKAAEGNWRVINPRDIMKWGDYLLDEFDLFDLEMFPNGFNSNRSYFFWSSDYAENFPLIGMEYYKGSNSSEGQIKRSNSFLTFVLRESYIADSKNFQCYIVTEVRPEIEYHVVQGAVAELEEEVNDSLSNGWNLIGGFSSRSDYNCHQAIWRWAE